MVEIDTEGPDIEELPDDPPVDEDPEELYNRDLATALALSRSQQDSFKKKRSNTIRDNIRLFDTFAFLCFTYE